MSPAIGHTQWTFAAGFVPVESTGPEPEFTSRDELCVLNTGDDAAHLSIMIYHCDDEPVGPYEVTVGAQRVSHFRINDLIDPQAIPLGVPYGAVVESTVPVVVQMSRLDTRTGHLSSAIASGHPGEAAG